MYCILTDAGADYMSEYRFLNGSVERTCDLCEEDVVESVLEHTKRTEHIAAYLVSWLAHCIH
jgi:hypothetical protein